MTLIEDLQRARTEEDVKDAYIKALGLKGVFKGLVDIQTPEICFEAKEAPTPPLLMFAQLLSYVHAARKRGEAIPGFLCVIDREKAALLETRHAMPILDNDAIAWPKSGSMADNALAAQIAPTLMASWFFTASTATRKNSSRRQRTPSVKAASSAPRSRPTICGRCSTNGWLWSASNWG